MSVDNAGSRHHRVTADVCVRKEYRMLTLAERQGINYHLLPFLPL